MKNKLRLVSVCALSAAMFLSACGASDKQAASEPAAQDKAAAPAEKGISGAEAGTVSPELHYESKYYSVDLPESWDGLWMAQEYNSEAQNFDGTAIGARYNTTFYCKDCYENFEGTGFVVSVELTEDPPVSIEYIGGDCVGIITNDESGEKLYVRLGYPTDVQFDEDTQDVYMKMYENRAALLDTFAPADGWSFERMSYAEVMSDFERTFDGVVMSVDNDKVAFLNDSEVNTVTFNVSDDAALKDVEAGHIYTITYTGTIMNNNPEESKLISIVNADANYDYNMDAAAFAAKIITAVNGKDMKALTEYCKFPVEVNDMVFASAEEFSAMKFEDVFSDELERFIKNIRLTELPSGSNEIKLSILPDYSHILIKNDGGEWKITGFYNIATDF